jgi:hypothetical protein
VRPVAIDPTGIAGPTRGQTVGPRWRQTSHGFYVPSSVDPDMPEQRIIEASMFLPPQGAVTGWGALRFWRANFFDGLGADRVTRLPVPLIAGRGQARRKRRGVTRLQYPLEPGETVTRHGCRCTRIHRALFDEMRNAPDLREAVVAMDMAAAAELTSIGRMVRYTERFARCGGVGQVREALRLADENSRSPNESRMRLIWQLDAGFPRPMVNREVWDLRGRSLGVVDLFDPVAGVVGEFDGADHRGARRQSDDVDREAGFRDHYLEFFRVTGLDLPNRPRVVRRMASTRGRAKWLTEGQRSWTIVPPPGVEEPASLDAILDERDLVREVHAEWELERTAVQAHQPRG